MQAVIAVYPLQPYSRFISYQFENLVTDYQKKCLLCAGILDQKPLNWINSG